ncbi:hypothetical protein M407DRAFT_241812 [Tulasnella calospora MUT 4182]|uniref:Secreted protein n=1 Tax=Tulasnella calospora MUT 4182 TaxID=1051891 RepID=A0A0C3QTF2_9AGAM|nr:hypothetical protein M407DRAFT_241812 [Tulasnella calospora MUT 4182]
MPRTPGLSFSVLSLHIVTTSFIASTFESRVSSSTSPRSSNTHITNLSSHLAQVEIRFGVPVRLQVD